MITFWLVVLLSVGGGKWIPLDIEQMPTHDACIAAEIEVWEYIHGGHIKDDEGKEVREAHKLAVGCEEHHPESEHI